LLLNLIINENRVIPYYTKKFKKHTKLKKRFNVKKTKQLNEEPTHIPSASVMPSTIPSNIPSTMPSHVPSASVISFPPSITIQKENTLGTVIDKPSKNWKISFRLIPSTPSVDSGTVYSVIRFSDRNDYENYNAEGDMIPALFYYGQWSFAFMFVDDGSQFNFQTYTRQFTADINEKDIVIEAKDDTVKLSFDGIEKAVIHIAESDRIDPNKLHVSVGDRFYDPFPGTIENLRFVS